MNQAYIGPYMAVCHDTFMDRLEIATKRNAKLAQVKRHEPSSMAGDGWCCYVHHDGQSGFVMISMIVCLAFGLLYRSGAKRSWTVLVLWVLKVHALCLFLVKASFYSLRAGG